MKKIAHLLKDIRGVAMVEFAMISPLLLLFIAGSLDIGYGFFLKLRLISATSAAAQYAFANGQSVTSSTLAAYLTNVATVVTSTAALQSPPTVTVLYNNAAGAANIGNYYCVAAGSPPVWTSTGTSSASCGGNLLSGQFVTITAQATASAFFNPDPILGTLIPASDTLIVRVQ